MTENQNGDDSGVDVPSLSIEEEGIVQGDDSKSAKEALELSSGLPEREIKKRALEAEAKRTEKFRDHFEGLAVWSLYLIWGFLVLVGIVWAYHLIVPPCWPRLPEDQVRNLQAIITGGFLAGIAGGFLKRRLE